jgi:DNA-directed RNA polymerase specialized sigma24 family protein
VDSGDEDDSLNTAEIEASIPQFEGLLFATATKILEVRNELERDEIQQRLRIKVWKGLKSYDAARATQPIRRYVFSCVMNEKKDILKAYRRFDSYIEDVAPASDSGPDVGPRDAFELRYLSIDAEQAFAAVETRALELPATLDPTERTVIGLLYEGWLQTEIRRELGISMRGLYEVLASLREKMADWRPTPSERPVPPLPRPLRAEPNLTLSGALP